MTRADGDVLDRVVDFPPRSFLLDDDAPGDEGQRRRQVHVLGDVCLGTGDDRVASIRITLYRMIPGMKYDDTCLSELYLLQRR